MGFRNFDGTKNLPYLSPYINFVYQNLMNNRCDNQTTSNNHSNIIKREKHERSNCWELNPGQLVMTTSCSATELQLPQQYPPHALPLKLTTTNIWCTFLISGDSLHQYKLIIKTQPISSARGHLNQCTLRAVTLSNGEI